MARGEPANWKLYSGQDLGDHNRLGSNLCYVLGAEDSVCHAARPSCWPVGSHPLYRRRCHVSAGGTGSLLPVGLVCRVCLGPDRVQHHPAVGRKPACPLAAFWGGEFAPGSYHLRSARVRRIMGILGIDLCRAPRHSGACCY